jgi:hypothetical protein
MADDTKPNAAGLALLNAQMDSLAREVGALDHDDPKRSPPGAAQKNVPETFQFCAKNRCQTVAVSNKPKIKKPGFPGFLSLGITSCF